MTEQPPPDRQQDYDYPPWLPAGKHPFCAVGWYWFIGEGLKGFFLVRLPHNDEAPDQLYVSVNGKDVVPATLYGRWRGPYEMEEPQKPEHRLILRRFRCYDTEDATVGFGVDFGNGDGPRVVMTADAQTRSWNAARMVLLEWIDASGPTNTLAYDKVWPWSNLELDDKDRQRIRDGMTGTPDPDDQRINATIQEERGIAERMRETKAAAGG